MNNRSRHTFRRVAYREAKRLIRGRMYWFCILIAPLASAAFFLSLMNKGLPDSLPAALVDLDQSTSSRKLARQLDAFTATDLSIHCASFGEARREMQQGNVYAIYLIPEDFEKDLLTGRQPMLSFYTNQSYLIAGSLLFRDMKTASSLVSASAALSAGLARGYGEAQLIPQIQAIAIDVHPLGNPWLNYSVYLNNIILPAILALMIMSVTVYSIGIEIKERTSLVWLRSGGGSIIRSLAGKLLPQFVAFFIVGILIYVLLYLVQGFPMAHPAGMLVALVLLIASSQALGVFMIGLLPSLRLGLSAACIWGMIAFSASGFSFPVVAMYPAVQALTNLFPLRHYFLLYVDQALMGRDIVYSLAQYGALAAFLLLPFLVLPRLKKALIHSTYKP